MNLQILSIFALLTSANCEEPARKIQTVRINGYKPIVLASCLDPNNRGDNILLSYPDNNLSECSYNLNSDADDLKSSSYYCTNGDKAIILTDKFKKLGWTCYA